MQESRRMELYGEPDTITAKKKGSYPRWLGVGSLGLALLAGGFGVNYVMNRKGVDKEISMSLQNIKERGFAEVEGEWFYPDTTVDDYDRSDLVQAFLAYMETDETKHEFRNPVRMIIRGKHVIIKRAEEEPEYTRMREIANKDKITEDEKGFYLRNLSKYVKNDGFLFGGGAHRNKYRKDGKRFKFRIISVEDKSVADLSEDYRRTAERFGIEIQDYKEIHFGWDPARKGKPDSWKSGTIKIDGNWHFLL